MQADPAYKQRPPAKAKSTVRSELRRAGSARASVHSLNPPCYFTCTGISQQRGTTWRLPTVHFTSHQSPLHTSRSSSPTSLANIGAFSPPPSRQAISTATAASPSRYPGYSRGSAPCTLHTCACSTLPRFAQPFTIAQDPPSQGAASAVVAPVLCTHKSHSLDATMEIWPCLRATLHTLRD